jgi:hypothetical protein
VGVGGGMSVGGGWVGGGEGREGRRAPPRGSSWHARGRAPARGPRLKPARRAAPARAAAHHSDDSERPVSRSVRVTPPPSFCGSATTPLPRFLPPTYSLCCWQGRGVRRRGGGGVGWLWAAEGRGMHVGAAPGGGPGGRAGAPAAGRLGARPHPQTARRAGRGPGGRPRRGGRPARRPIPIGHPPSPPWAAESPWTGQTGSAGWAAARGSGTCPCRRTRPGPRCRCASAGGGAGAGRS